MRLGFIGTGTITAAMVRGLKGSALQDWPILLSPRNADLAAALATLPGVTIAPDNQAVVDGSDMVFLAVRPDMAEAVLRPLRIRTGQRLVSLMAGIAIPVIEDWTGCNAVTRAIPLPFVETRSDVTPIHPPEPSVAALFDALGQALPVERVEDFDIYAAASALMESYFGIVEAAANWAAAQGLDRRDAETYLAGLFGNLGDVLRANPHELAELRAGHSTKGGLNEQVFREFRQAGGLIALEAAMGSVLRRIKG